MMAQCSKCGSLISSVSLNEISINAPADAWRGVTYACPSCNSVLGVGINPISLKADIVEEIAALLRSS